MEFDWNPLKYEISNFKFVIVEFVRTPGHFIEITDVPPVIPARRVFNIGRLGLIFSIAAVGALCSMILLKPG